MLSSTRKMITATLLATIAVSPAHAVMTTWTFTGTVLPGYVDAGQTVTGSIAYDPLSYSSLFTDGSYQYTYSFYSPPYQATNPLAGSTSVGANAFNNIGGGG